MVHRSSDTWHTMDTIWISNGKTNDVARVQVRVRFEGASHEQGG